MATKYIYLDDEDEATVRAYVDEVEGNTEGLVIEHHAPLPYGEQLEWLKTQSFDGLILDLRLDEMPNWERPDSGRVDYRAAALAQELRTRAAETSRNDTPIVLWSTYSKLDRSYRRDDFSHDLYDLKTRKEEIETADGGGLVGQRLVSLATGYERILEVKRSGKGSGRFFRFLGFDEDPGFLHPRLLQHFEGRGQLPAHILARFILEKVVKPEGSLIDRRTLLARLGLQDSDSEVADSVVQRFDSARYGGPFANGWPRWWGRLVEVEWLSLAGADKPLRRTTAEERVQHLGAALGRDDLAVAEMLPSTTSSCYWTTCRATDRPLDPRDGFALADGPQDSWQSDQYVSLDAIERDLLSERDLRLSPLEASRAVRTNRD